MASYIHSPALRFSIPQRDPAGILPDTTGNRPHPGIESTCMGDLTSPHLIILKGVLFVVIGLICSITIMADAIFPEIDLSAATAITMHLLAVWAFCRAYYFAFYVIQHYLDPSFRFAGLMSAARWLMRSPRNQIERE